MSKNKGTWERVSHIMEQHGFNPRRGVCPAMGTLDNAVRTMMTQAYVQGYWDAKPTKKGKKK